MQQQQQTENGLALQDNSKLSAFELIERNIMRDVEVERKTAFQNLEAQGQNHFCGLVGKLGLETFEKYRMPLNRIASYVNQALEMAIDHYNFVVRREELDVPDQTFATRSASDTSASNALPSMIPAEVVRLLAVSLMVIDAGNMEAATAMKQQALTMVERNITTHVEKTRRVEFQLFDAFDPQTFAGLIGRIGLETVARYRLPVARVKSYINQAYHAAVDHYNFVSRRESLDRPLLSFIAMVNDGTGTTTIPDPTNPSLLITVGLPSDSFDPNIPAEVVRLLVLSYIANDEAAIPATTRVIEQPR